MENLIFRQTRIEMGLTKSAMAKVMGLSLRGYEELEAGRVDATNPKYLNMLIGAAMQAYAASASAVVPSVVRGLLANIMDKQKAPVEEP